MLLMDEPFGALDAMTRDLLHDELERLWQATGLTVLFVTHNVREAVRLGDRVVLLSSRPGRVGGGVPRRHRRARGASRHREVADARRRRSPTACARRCAAMAVDARTLDARPAARRASSPASTPSSRSSREPTAVAASGRRSGRSCCADRHRPRWLWQLVVWTRLEAGVRPPGAARVFEPPVSTTRRPPSSGTRSTTLRARRLGLRASPSSSASRSARWSSRSRGSCARPSGSMITGPPDDAVDRVVPARDPAVQAHRGGDHVRRRARRGAVDRQRPHRTASTTSRRSCCGPGACSAPRARRTSATSSCPRRCRASSAASSRAGRSPGAA